MRRPWKRKPLQRRRQHALLGGGAAEDISPTCLKASPALAPVPRWVWQPAKRAASGRDRDKASTLLHGIAGAVQEAEGPEVAVAALSSHSSNRAPGYRAIAAKAKARATIVEAEAGAAAGHQRSNNSKALRQLKAGPSSSRSRSASNNLSPDQRKAMQQLAAVVKAEAVAGPEVGEGQVVAKVALANRDNASRRPAASARNLVVGSLEGPQNTHCHTVT